MADHIIEAKRVLNIEIQALMQLSESLGDSFNNAVESLYRCQGKVILTGMGKSGLVAQKMSSTLSSTGTPSFFLHPAESSHGDLGVITPQDVVVAISYGGESSEMYSLFQFVMRRDIFMIGMTGNITSSLARASKVVLDIKVKEEACPLGLAPTSSTTVTLALGDALAMALLKYKGFKETDFAEFHPGGSLGRRLLTRVKDVMHKGDALPTVQPEEEMSEVISLMTSKQVRGVAGVVDSKSSIIGIITDGDIRRQLNQKVSPFEKKAKEIMSFNPKTIDQNEMAVQALNVMEKFKIQSLFVVDTNSNFPQKPIGVVHLQDLLSLQ